LLQQELRANEISAADALTKLHDIERQIDKKGTHLQKLRDTKEHHQDNLARERDRLTHQIRTAYRIGRNDYLKLLLNQEDPALVGRVLAYYDYQNRARVDRINAVIQQLDALNQVEQTIKDEAEALQQLKYRQVGKLDEFKTFRRSRKEIIARLQHYIGQQGTQLTTLQENERDLENLLQQLRDEKVVTIEIFEDIPPFNSLKGKLEWPVPARITTRFGSRKKGGKLKWQGVRLNTDAGTDVHAVGTGKVVFADWFRNLGLLIILDHGDGFMSLYGHNQSLAKKTGDWVLPGEIISSVGDSGGQNQSGLYFEIRKDGTPLNPSQWCQNVSKR
jgi:septal ring factor EnvC (AmiA/AmiB activator)